MILRAFLHDVTEYFDDGLGPERSDAYKRKWDIASISVNKLCRRTVQKLVEDDSQTPIVAQVRVTLLVENLHGHVLGTADHWIGHTTTAHAWGTCHFHAVAAVRGVNARAWMDASSLLDTCVSQKWSWKWHVSHSKNLPSNWTWSCIFDWDRL